MLQQQRNHLKALLTKELLQIQADQSVLIVAFLIPLVLVLIYGYALRMDIKPVETVLVAPHFDDTISRDLAFQLQGSDYVTLSVVNNEKDARQLLRLHEVSSKISLPIDLQRQIQSPFLTPTLLITVNGDDAQQAKLASVYLSAIIASTLEKYVPRSPQMRTAMATAPAPLTLLTRNWFNEQNNSTWYLMAGQIIGVITLMSAFMTSIVIAREFERGTMEGLLATHVSATTFLLSKIIPYYTLAIFSAALTVLIALILFQMPFRGNLILYIVTLLVYLYVSLMIGLLISAATKNQFLSSEYAVIISFLPSILLSGALFDLRAIPQVIYFIAHLMPPTYAVESSKICILSGGNVDIIFENLAILSVFAIVLTYLCFLLLKRYFKRTPAQRRLTEPSPAPHSASGDFDEYY